MERPRTPKQKSELSQDPLRIWGNHYRSKKKRKKLIAWKEKHSVKSSASSSLQSNNVDVDDDDVHDPFVYESTPERDSPRKPNAQVFLSFFSARLTHPSGIGSK